MASNNTVASSQQQQAQQSHQQPFQQPNSQHHCKECGLFFDSGKSLEVHLQYHKENLLNKWATQASQSASGSASDETNNNNTKSNNNKREFSSHPNTIAAAADSSDAMLKSASNKSPDSFASRTTPETSTTSFGHPPTPQSYSSAPSPYQTADGANFSPGYQGYVQVKSERASPLNHYPTYQPQQHMYPADPNQYFMEQHAQAQQQQQLGYPQDYPVHKIPSQSSAGFRYHPYQHSSPYERSPQVSSSSPAYPSQNPQPTPSPSPKQCDKCGCVCDSAAQLIDHLNHAHPPTPAPHLNNPFTQHPSHQQHSQQHFQFNTLDKTEIKTEDEPQTEILDLDSHKVHQVFQTPEEEESMKRHNGELSNLNGPNPHSVSAMLNSWPNGSPQQNKMFSPSGAEHRTFFQEQKMFSNGQENKMYQGNMADSKMFQQEQKLFQPHQMHSPDFVSTNGVTTTSQDGGAQGLGQYRSFEHMPPQPQPPVISSTQLPNVVPSNNPVGPPPKGANWKSNEARRPKTYNCSACNKWFTSSGHLKRHYNTTLHKNAVKSSGQPDPATMPISAHHHPGRDNNSRNSDTHSSNTSPDPMDDARDDAAAAAFERTQMPGMLQQPPSGPYDRQQPPPNLHSPMGGNPTNPLTNLSAGSPPNGEAGPSATNQDHSRGLLSISTPSTPQQITPLSPMVGSMSTGSNQLGFSLLNQAPHPHLMGMPSPGPGSGPGELSQPAFPPPTMSQPSSMPATYPNGLAPHVMQAMATSSQPQALTSLTTTGEAAFTPELLQYAGLQAQQLPPYMDQQPLPSFAQFQPHRYGLLLAAGYPHQYQANVGGFGSVPPEHHQAFAPVANSLDLEARGLVYHDTDGGNYEITVLSNISGECILPDEASSHGLYSSTASSPAAATSPTHLPSNNNSNMHAMYTAVVAAEEHIQQQPPLIKLTKLSPASPIRDEIKREYENGSPRITSTGSPLAGKTAPASIHKCFDCDKMFNKACYLTQHNKTCHSGEMPYKCSRCGKRFANDDAYREHLAKHAGDKPYKCDQCPKQFNHKTDLRRHMCLHTGQKPYACDHCGKGFIRKDHMLKHADTHSRKTGQRQQH